MVLNNYAKPFKDKYALNRLNINQIETYKIMRVNKTEEKRKALLIKQREISDIYKPIAERIDFFKSELVQKATPSELAFKKLLDKHKIKYKFQKAFYNLKFRCIVDFYIQTGSTRIGIEIDGGYHFEEKQKLKDDYRESWIFKNRNCDIIRFTNEQVLNDCNSCLIELADFFLNKCNLTESINYKQFLIIKQYSLRVA